VRSVGVLLLLATTAGAAPTIKVKARTRLSIDGVSKIGGGARVSGRLLEVGNGEGLQGAMIFVTVDGRQQGLSTRSGGRFDADFSLDLGEYMLDVVYPGDAEHGRAEVRDYPFSLRKRTMQLTVRAPAEVDDTAPSFGVTVEALADGVVQQVVVRVAIQDAAGKEPSSSATRTSTPPARRRPSASSRPRASRASRCPGARCDTTRSSRRAASSSTRPDRSPASPSRSSATASRSAAPRPAPTARST
jgi:hypothetical protein